MFKIILNTFSLLDRPVATSTERPGQRRSLGGLVYAIAAAFPTAADDAREKAEQAPWERIVNEHLNRSVDLVSEYMRGSVEQSRDFLQRLAR